MNDICLIIPCHTSDNFRECLESVANQNDKDFSTIVVFDNCTDNSPQILQEYEARINDLQVFFTNGGKPSIARNKGIRESTAKYITFLDSDDFLYPYAIAVIKADINARPGQPAYHFGIATPKSDLPIGFAQIVYVFGKAYYREYLIKNNLLFAENIEYEEDMLFNHAIEECRLRTAQDTEVMINPTNIVFYNENPNSMTRKYPEKCCFDSWILAKLFCHNCNTEEYTELANKTFLVNAYHICKLAVIGRIKTGRFFELVKECETLRAQIPHPHKNIYEKFAMYRQRAESLGQEFVNYTDEKEKKAVRIYKKYFERIIGMKHELM